MGEIIRTLSDSDKPLCPSSTNVPIHEAHMLRNRVLDAFYNAAEKDADGEMSEPLNKAYNAAAYERVSDRMDLFVEQVAFMRGGQQVVVESWWFKCPVCGLILPAQRRSDT